MQKIKNKELQIMFRLFFINKYIKKREVENLLGEKNLTLLLEKEILKTDEDNIYSLIKITPYDKFYFLSTGPFYTDIKKRVYIGPDSFLLADDIKKYFGHKTYEKGLDICSGSGIQSLTLSEFTREVTGVDINKNAIAFAEKNARLNKKENVNFVLSNLYENIKEEYDIIVSNTPFGYLPEDLSHWLPGYGGEWGIEIPLKIIEGFKKHLKPDGVALACLTSPIVGGRNLLLEKLKEMFSGTDFSIKAKVIQNCLIPDLYQFHKEKGVKYFTYYHMFFKKGGGGSLEVEDMNKTAYLEGQYGLVTQRIMGHYRPYLLKKEGEERRKILSLGKKEASLGNKEKARGIFKELIRKKPDFAPAYLELAKVFLQEGKIDLAEENFRNTINLKDDELEAYCHLGYINMEKKNKDEAKKYFKKALKIAQEKQDREMELEIKKILRTTSYL